jgi:hypothetical protein
MFGRTETGEVRCGFRLAFCCVRRAGAVPCRKDRLIKAPNTILGYNG